MVTATNIASLDPASQEHFRRLTHTQRALRRLRNDYLTLGAIAVLLFLILSAVTAPLTTRLVGIDPEKEDLQTIFAKPSSENWLGTDDKGRDHLARLLYGGRISLSIAFSASALSLTIGVMLGMTSGFYGGIIDDLLIWIITTLNSIPFLFLLLVVSSVFHPGPLVFVVLLGLLGWTGVMRLVRGETLSMREREFIVAARAMGASDLRIMLQHILPNLVSVVIISMAIDIGTLILIESGLSFLGFGINPPTPTWGNMLSESAAFLRQAPHLLVAPGLLITITVLCLYVIGDGLRDALDPTTVD